MDDLTRIQTYEHLPASNPSEQQQKTWASNVGFAATITKPYYWQAATSKERDFFIGSLVKIYKKYTGGKTPELLGFDPRDRDAIVGTAGPGAPPSRSHGPSPAHPDGQSGRSRSPSAQPRRPQSPPHANRAASREGPKENRRQPSREQFLRAQPSQEQVPRRPQVPSSKPSQSSLSRDEMPSKAPDSRTTSEVTPPSSLPTNRQPKQSDDSRLNDESNLPKKPADNEGIRRQNDHAEPQGEPTGVAPLEVTKSKPSFTDMKESGKLRAPLGSRAGSSGQDQVQSESTDKFVTPVSSSEQTAGDVRLPSQSSNKPFGGLENDVDRSKPVIQPSDSKASDRTPQATPTPSPDPATEQPKQPDQTSTPSGIAQPAAPAPLQAKSTATPEAPTAPGEKGEDDESHRPGLGPMVKKKGPKEIASAFKKAATAYNAFKPRPGGAAERFMAAKEKEKKGDEPDGITGVVPAPLTRGVNNDDGKATDDATNDSMPSQQISNQEVPKVSVSDASPQDKVAPATTTALEVRRKSPSPSGDRRRQRQQDNMAKYCNVLGIDATLLHGRGTYFDDILTDLGWDGKLDGEKRIEDFEADVRREIGRVQASSWLGHLELQEGKVDQLATFLDKTIEECEELDGLLTLYSHELNVIPLRSFFTRRKHWMLTFR